MRTKTGALKYPALLDSSEFVPIDRPIIINKSKILTLIQELKLEHTLLSLRSSLFRLESQLRSIRADKVGLLNIDLNGDTIAISQKCVFEQLNQIAESQTLDRAKYYVERFEKAITQIRTSKINDINLNRWKEYQEVITDSLWILDKRDNSGAHMGWYWGNFIPQIPHQMMLRYTQKGDWVLDAFVGSGTTLIECRRLGRNGIGIELNPEVAEKANELINVEQNRNNVISEVVVGDSRTIDIKAILDKYRISQVQFLIMHPPYHDIIKFSKNDGDLSNAKNTEEFLKMFGEVLDNATPYLEKGRYFALVIGDKYSKGEWIPLGFYCMNEVLKRDFSLKSIIVKNFEETRGKRNQKELGRLICLN